jgi:hypothetical protein
MRGKSMWAVDVTSKSSGISFISLRCFSSCSANILRNPLPAAAVSCRVHVQAITVCSDWEKLELFCVNLKTTNMH